MGQNVMRNKLKITQEKNKRDETKLLFLQSFECFMQV